jgi:glycosyltransferase involved in cell wall biosynthesis
LNFSIIICTYKNEIKLSKAISSLIELTYDKGKFEIVVVDNGSDNLTEHLILKERILSNFVFSKLKVVFEPNRGLVNARRNGLKASEFEYVVYCDEDNYLNMDYLNVAYNILEFSNISLLGGRTTNEHCEDNRMLAIGRQYHYSRLLNFGEMLWGAGLVIKKSLISQLLSRGLILSSLDTRGSGEDYELNFLYQLNNHNCYYSDDLVLYHDVDQSRFDVEQLNKLAVSNAPIDFMISKFWSFYDFKKMSRLDKVVLVLKTLVKSFLRKDVNLKDRIIFEMILFANSKYLTELNLILMK